MIACRLLLCIVCCIGTTIANEDPSIDDKIYELLGGVYPCFRLTNATHQIGCSASSTQTRGVVHVVNKMEDIDWLINHSGNGAYIVAMEDIMFNKSNIMKLMEARVDGIIVKHDTTNVTRLYPEHFSPEHRCPNSLFGLGSDATCASDPKEDWNPYGNSLTFYDFGDFPIFAVTADTYNRIVECYLEHNLYGNDNKQHYPLCSLEMRADMYVVKDTETCMRRAKLPLHQISGRSSICDPLGDNNVWTMPQGILDDLSDKRIILVATKLDSTAFFRDLSFGANNDAAAIASMIAVMDTIGSLMRNGLVKFDNTNKTLMFMFFQGESWDYIGSSRMVYDIINHNFPHKISMENIDSIVELSHVGIQENTSNDTGTFYIHGNYDQPGSKASEILKVMQSFASNDINIINSSLSRLPPASAQSFLRENSSISTVVIGDYKEHYNNKYYGSMFDDILNLNVTYDNDTGRIDDNSSLVLQLKELSQVITNTLLSLSDQSVNVSRVTTNASLIAESLYCILYNSSCLLFKGVLEPSDADNLRSAPYSRYVTISTITNAITIQMWHLIPYLLAWQRDVTTKSDCSVMDGDVWQVRWLRGDGYNYSCQRDNDCLGVCINSSKVEYHFAESPAFVLEQYGSTRYSTWAESTWSTILLRMYLVTSIEHQLGILIGGMMIQIVSLYISIMCWKRGRLLFTIATVQSHDL